MIARGFGVISELKDTGARMFDSPPVIPFADAQSLGRLSDALVLVACMGRQRGEQSPGELS